MNLVNAKGIRPTASGGQLRPKCHFEKGLIGVLQFKRKFLQKVRELMRVISAGFPAVNQLLV